MYEHRITLIHRQTEDEQLITIRSAGDSYASVSIVLNRDYPGILAFHDIYEVLTREAR